MLRISLFSLATLAVALPARGETITVCASGCDHSSIQNAVEAAVDGDVIQFAAETYVIDTPIDLGGRSLDFAGETGSDDRTPSTIVRCEGVRAFEPASMGDTLALRGIMFSGGDAGNVEETVGPFSIRGCGGTICARTLDHLLIERCRFTDSTAISGGAIDVRNATSIEYRSLDFQDCWATGEDQGPFPTTDTPGGASYTESRTFTAVDCVFRDNQAGTNLPKSKWWARGGGLAAFSIESTLVQACEFIGNTSNLGSGGARLTSTLTGSITVRGCNFENNLCDSEFICGFDAGLAGLSVWHQTTDGDVLIEDCDFTDNVGSSVGGLALNSEAVARRCRFIDNAGFFASATSTYTGPTGTLENCLFCGSEDNWVEAIQFCSPSTRPIDGGSNVYGGANCLELCEGDIDLDGIVGGGDMGLLLLNWGQPMRVRYDIDGNGVVGAGDLGFLLSSWGDCL